MTHEKIQPEVPRQEVDVSNYEVAQTGYAREVEDVQKSSIGGPDLPHGERNIPGLRNTRGLGVLSKGGAERVGDHIKFGPNLVDCLGWNVGVV